MLSDSRRNAAAGQWLSLSPRCQVSPVTTVLLLQCEHTPAPLHLLYTAAFDTRQVPSYYSHSAQARILSQRSDVEGILRIALDSFSLISRIEST
jgi:hypothetical protein